jgi:hypothetical protein
MKSSFVQKIFLTVIGILFFVSAPIVVQAQSLSERIMGQVRVGGDSANYDTSVEAPQAFAVQAIQVFLGLLATIFLVLILMSGFWLITARGDESKYEKAMYTIKRAIIGFVIIMASYALVWLVARTVLQSVGLQDTGTHCVGNPDINNAIIDNTFCSRFNDEQACSNAQSDPLSDLTLGAASYATRECIWVP